MSNKIINNWVDNYPGIWEQRPLSAITYLGVCHTAAQLNNRNLKQICDLVNEWHQAKGWACISYHYMIAQNGEIAQINSHDANSFTVGDKRYNTLCVCLDGNFEIDEPTIEQLESLNWLLTKLSNDHPEFPASAGDVYGDNELNLDTGNPTACPGRNLMPYIQEFRNTGKMTIGNGNTQESQPVPQPDFTGLNNAEIAIIQQNDIINVANTFRDRHTTIGQLKAEIEVLKKNSNPNQSQNLGNQNLPKNSNLRAFLGFIKNQAPTIISSLAGMGYVVTQDQIIGGIGLLLLMLTYVNSYLLEIKNRK
jgi:N-acetylmuramoyl-L-alanine amidase